MLLAFAFAIDVTVAVVIGMPCYVMYVCNNGYTWGAPFSKNRTRRGGRVWPRGVVGDNSRVLSPPSTGEVDVVRST